MNNGGLFGVIFKFFGAFWLVWMAFCLCVGLAVLSGLGYLGYTVIQWIQADTARIEAGE